jgi:hypothetical protein
MAASDEARLCAYLTMDSLSDFVSDAAMSVPAMNALGWSVRFVPWREPAVDWNAFDLVYICTPWDYQNDPDAYLEVLADIEASTALLINPLDTVRWNLDKTYLRELESHGVNIVPSRWHECWHDDALEEAFRAFNTGRIVIKPQVGANADHTYVISAASAAEQSADMAAVFASRPFYVQPFVDAVQTEGEYSLFYFGGEYSHAILKTPRAGDFRSQEEHGADIKPAAADAPLRQATDKVLRVIEHEPVYARADFVRSRAGDYLLMELELNEPSLYFRVDPESAVRFAAALDAAYRRRA